MNKKVMSKLIVASVLVGGINFLPVNFSAQNLQIISVAHAEVKDVTAKDAAILDFADENPTLTAQVQNVAKMRAIERAKERAGVYLQSYSRTVNGVLTADDISAYTSNSIKVEDVKYQKLFYQVKDASGNLTGKVGFMYEATVTAKIDTAGLLDYIQKSTQEKQALIERDKNQQKNVADVNSLYESLRKNADNKTPTQINAELEQINQKISAQNKPAEKNSSMIFSQPQKIGFAGVPPYGGQSPYYKGGYFFEGTSYNSGNIISGSKNEYRKGLARWGEGNDALYCEYDSTNNSLKFGGKNNFLVSDEIRRDILKIETNEKITLYSLYYRYKQFTILDVIGCKPDGTWVKYIDMRQIDEKYFGKYPRNSELICGTENWGKSGDYIICRGDTIIIPYHLLVDYKLSQRGEFRFKWNDLAQWFGVEKVTY